MQERQSNTASSASNKLIEQYEYVNSDVDSEENEFLEKSARSIQSTMREKERENVSIESVQLAQANNNVQENFMHKISQMQDKMSEEI